MGITDNLREQGWEEPIDSSPVEVPPGWYGGKVWDSGGRTYIRTWLNVEKMPTEDDDIESYLEIGYDSGFKGASVHLYVKDEDGRYYHDKVIDKRESNEQTDASCAEKARELMKEY